MIETTQYQEGQSIEQQLLKLNKLTEFLIKNKDQQTKENIERLRKTIERNVWRSWKPFVDNRSQTTSIAGKFY